jgi:hypothetical protein
MCVLYLLNVRGATCCPRPQAPSNQSLGVFTSVVVIVSVGSLVVTVQAKVGYIYRRLCNNTHLPFKWS